MPYDMAMESELSRRQFHAVARELFAENERLESERAELWRGKRDVEASRDTKTAVIAELKAEIAGLKTGYEAYEQVVQGLKAENDRQRLDIEAWRLSVDAERASRDAYKAELERLQGPLFAKESDALRKDAERYRWLQQWYIEGRKRSEIHPDGHICFTTPAIMDAAIDTALSKGEQS